MFQILDPSYTNRGSLRLTKVGAENRVFPVGYLRVGNMDCLESVFSVGEQSESPAGPLFLLFPISVCPIRGSITKAGHASRP